MSTTTTSWVLDFIDHVTKPVKDMMKSIGSVTDSFDGVTNTVKELQNETKAAIYGAKKSYTELQKEINDTERELKSLEASAKSSTIEHEQLDTNQAYEEGVEKLKELKAALKYAEEAADDFNDETKEFENFSTNWTNMTLGINQGVDQIQKSTD